MVPSYRPLGQLMGLFILFLCPLIRAPMPITSRSEPIAAFHSRTLDPSLRVGAPVVSLNFLSPWLFPFLSPASFFLLHCLFPFDDRPTSTLPPHS